LLRSLTRPGLPRFRTFPMQYRPLGRTGFKVSALSYGASPLGNAFRQIDEGEGIRAVHTALELGLNFIDTSPFYGVTKSETILGRALRGVPRDKYLLGTKVGQYAEGQFDFSAARVRSSLEESCARLGVDHIDILQCHDVEFVQLDQIVNETLPALVELRREGRIGAVGMTGLPLKVFPAVIDRVPAGTVDVILSFCHYELNDTTLLSLLPYFAQRGIGVINAAPTGMGLLSDRPAPAWHPASASIIAGCRRAAEFCRARGVDIVKLAIQFAVAHPGIATTVVGSASPENMRKNVAYAEEPLDPTLLAEVLAVLQPIRDHNFTRGRPENRDPLVS
jgi:L-galactose dehydrogenase